MIETSLSANYNITPPNPHPHEISVKTLYAKELDLTGRINSARSGTLNQI
jgi:hypothetical protein